MIEHFTATQLEKEFIVGHEQKVSIQESVEALPEWFVFDEKSALNQWESNYAEAKEPILSEHPNASQENVNDLPEWFAYDEKTALAKWDEENASQPNIKDNLKLEEEIKMDPVKNQIPQDKIFKPTFSNQFIPYEYNASQVNKRKEQAIKEPVVIIDYDAQASKGLSKIAASLDSMDYVTKAIAEHMAACIGIDGHKAKNLNTESINLAREKAMVNVMNTSIGKKLSSGENLTDQDQKNLNDIISMTYESTLGIDTKNVRNNGINLSDISQVQTLMPYILPPHIHGVSCSHGGGLPMSTGSISLGAPALPEMSVTSFSENHNHENHNGDFMCQSCKKTHHLHIHDKKDIICPSCKSRNLMAIKKKKYN